MFFLHEKIHALYSIFFIFIQLRVEAYNPSYPTYKDTALITINVNRNVNKPSFLIPMYTFNFDESTSPGTSVGKIQATDADKVSLSSSLSAFSFMNQMIMSLHSILLFVNYALLWVVLRKSKVFPLILFFFFKYFFQFLTFNFLLFSCGTSKSTLVKISLTIQNKLNIITMLITNL